MNKHHRPFLEELINWEGVDYYFDTSSRKHDRLVVSFEGSSRFLVCSRTPSDRRAVLNQISDLRRICRSLGAERKGKEWKTTSSSLGGASLSA